MVNHERESSAFGPASIERLQRETFVREIEHHQEIGSTNDRALELAADGGVRLPFLVIADRQLTGRGRSANRWWSAPGALTFSLLLDLRALGVSLAGSRIALTAGLAVSEALQQIRPGLEIGLKWPNDVYVQERKICGILVEVPHSSSQRIVMGIGVNVNNSLKNAPPSLAASAIALIDVARFSLDLATVLIRILEQLRESLLLLESSDQRLVDRWQAFCILTGRGVRVDAGLHHTIGTCRGIDQTGALLLDTNDGIRRCLAGTVSLLDG